MSTKTAALKEKSDYSGELFPIDEMVSVVGLGRIHTSEKTQANVRTCCVSGELHVKSTMFRTHHAKWVRGREVSEGRWFKDQHTNRAWPASYICHARNDNGDTIEISTQTREQLFFVCSYYGEFYPVDGRISVRDYGAISARAYRLQEGSVFYRCPECGSIVHSDSWDADEGMCQHCSRRGNPIDSYSSRTYPAPLCTPAEARMVEKLPKTVLRYYGIELEVEVRSGGNCAASGRRTRDVLGRDFVILKSDGSLDHGYEIVSAPSTFEIHQQRWVEFLSKQENRRLLRSWDTSTCGLHIHVTRAALSALQLGKMLVFVNRPENESFIKWIAGRDPSRWAKISSKKWSDGRQAGNCRTRARSREGDRYTAINTNNEKTIEFRLFKGTLSLDRFLSCLEFVDALCEFTSPASRSIKESVEVSAFCKYVEARRKIYPHLFARLVDHGDCVAPKRSEKSPVPALTFSGAE